MRLSRSESSSHDFCSTPPFALPYFVSSLPCRDWRRAPRVIERAAMLFPSCLPKKLANAGPSIRFLNVSCPDRPRHPYRPFFDISLPHNGQTILDRQQFKRRPRTGTFLQCGLVCNPPRSRWSKPSRRCRSTGFHGRSRNVLAHGDCAYCADRATRRRMMLAGLEPIIAAADIL